MSGRNFGFAVRHPLFAQTDRDVRAISVPINRGALEGYPQFGASFYPNAPSGSVCLPRQARSTGRNPSLLRAVHRRSSCRAFRIAMEIAHRHYDEMYAGDGAARPHCRTLAGWLTATPPERVAEKRLEADLLFHRVGITFAVYGDVAKCAVELPQSICVSDE